MHNDYVCLKLDIAVIVAISSSELFWSLVVPLTFRVFRFISKTTERISTKRICLFQIFFVPLENFSLIWDVIITGEVLQKDTQFAGTANSKHSMFNCVVNTNHIPRFLFVVLNTCVWKQF